VSMQHGRAGRYRQIMGTLVSYGFSELVAQLNPNELRLFERVRYGRLLEDRPDRPSRSQRRAVRLRLALEELGPTFIKLGQILSTRADLLPADIVAEFTRLQDSVHPAPFTAITSMIESQLGAPLDALFLNVDPSPLGSASIGQVHAATLLDGTSVVIKVQRPGIDRIIDTDIAILSDIAARADRYIGAAKPLDFPELVSEFGWTLRAELDFVAEAHNVTTLARIFEGTPGVRIPAVHWSHSRQKVLTLERLTGVQIDELAEIDALGLDRTEIAAQIVRAWFHMILDAGYYHADPHPGNILVIDAHTIGLLDFGMVGVLDNRLRQRILPILLAIVEQDPARIVEELTYVGVAPHDIALDALERDVRRLMARYYGRSLQEIRIADVIEEATSMIYRHRLRLPSEIALLMKTLAMTEAIARMLDPSLNVAEIAETSLKREIRKLFSPSYWIDQLKTQPLELMILGSALPRRLQRLLTRLDRQELTFRIHYDELPETLSALTGLVNRLATAILVAAGSIGLALMFNAVQPPMWSWRWNLFAVLFIVIGIATLRLMVGIMRSGK
jgi:ubiquinone biosynthesis protein